jgi:hypothetical protein
MTTTYDRSITETLTSMIECSDLPAALVAQVIRDAGGPEIETSDDAPDALNGDEALWVVSTHTLVVDRVAVATWTRCAVGSWGGSGGGRVDAWCVEEDTNGGDCLPERIEALLSALGIDDEIPSVPEPDSASDTVDEDPEGEWCVYWDTVGDDAHVVARYATEGDAQAVCDERARALKASQPGDLLCGYEVRCLVDSEWVRPESEA